MKQITAFEFKDLDSKIQKKIKAQFLEDRITLEIDLLTADLNKELITEKEYYDALGCSKYYAESTSWFVPSCYYEKHKEDTEAQVEEDLKTAVFTMDGRYIQHIS